MEELTPTFRPLQDNKPNTAVVVSLLVVITLFSSAGYVLAFYLK